MTNRILQRQTLPCRIAASAFLIASACSGFATAADDDPASTAEKVAVKPDRAGLQFFEKRIRPVLVKHCYECHSAESNEVKGGLWVDTREAIRAGGDSGPAVVPGRPNDGLLLDALRYESFEMPPAGKLPDRVIADFTRWIRMGAPDPRARRKPVKPEPDASDDKTDLWSLQPIDNPNPPAVRNGDWPRTGVDRFILARLEKKGLAPVGDAAPLTLLRRVHFDLVGLPPTPEDVAAFERDHSPEAYAAVVDGLLASPRFGERWGRHWMDVARYGESNGRSRDVLMPHAWRYRDYVIDAVNNDVPYDRFITEQIAGDLLPADDANERDRLKVATGFLAVGSKTLVGGTMQMDLVDEQIDTTSKAVLGLTAACARCHDHKFDPIPTRDYYALAGIFLSTETLYGGGLKRKKDLAGQSQQLVVLGENATTKIAEIQKQQKELAGIAKRQKTLANQQKKLQKRLPKDWQARLKELRRNQADAGEGDVASGTSGKNASAKKAADRGAVRRDKQILDYAKLAREIRELRERADDLKKSGPDSLEFAIGVRDAGKPRDAQIHIRGEANNKGDRVDRGFVSAIDIDEVSQVDSSSSGRLDLARWMTHADNPLTARVAVNRVWLHLFGRGIVPTVDNFGNNGKEPTHPHLLDHLAHRFIQSGWSRKQLIRELVLSRTYRLSSELNEANFAADPDNRLYWRAVRRRLEAEAIRDAMLAASGRLRTTPPDASPVAEIGDGEVGRGINMKPLKEPFPHRSVYLPILRGIIPEMLKVFDFPEPSNVKGRRDETNVPAQSLFLMNSPFVIRQAEVMATRVIESSSEPADRVERAFLLCYGRRPDAAETNRAVEFLTNKDPQRAPSNKTETKPVSEHSRWTTFCHALLASAEFRYID